MRAEADKARASIVAQREDLIAAARAEVQTVKHNLLAQTSQEVAKLRAEAETVIARDRAAAEAQLIAHASELSIEIARRLLGRFPHRILFSAFVDGICSEVRSLTAEARDSFAAGATTGRQIEVLTAGPLSDEETQEIDAALKNAFGTRISLIFHTDPAIIAGLEIHGANTIIRNSWGADLDRIRRELKS